MAVTKADLADPARACAEAAELLPGAEVVPVAAPAGEGLDELRAALDRVAAGIPGRGARTGALRLHVDRSFTIRGAGTVVTGTLWEGTAARGDEVRILPAGTAARIRSVQVHDEPRERAEAGQRVALNLAGVSRDEVARGDVGSPPRRGPERRWARRDVFGGRFLPRRRRARLGHARRAARRRHARRGPPRHARVAAPGSTELGGRYFQLRLEQPLVPARGDRVVIRSLAPPDTLGGGVVLDPDPPRHGPSRDLLARLARLERGEPEPEPEEPAPAPPPAELAPLTPAALALEERLREAGHEPPPDDAPDELAALRAHDKVVRLGRDMHIHREALDAVTQRVIEVIHRDGSITIATMRDELQTSRRYAQALLELLDAERVTLRVGDERVLRKKSG